MMQPKLKILDDELLKQIIDEGFELLMDPGVRVHNKEALKLLAERLRFWTAKRRSSGGRTRLTLSSLSSWSRHFPNWTPRVQR